MRPELTPTLARVVAAHERQFKKPLKWFSIGQFFRYEKQQRGRLREHYQLNCDIIGETALAADIELIALCIDLLRAFGLTEKDFVVRISDREFWTDFLEATRSCRRNSGRRCCRRSTNPSASRARKREEKLGPLAEPVFAIFDKRRTAARNSIDWSMDSARVVSPEFVDIDVRIVRGLAYYTGIVFEVFDRAGKLRAIAGGGRYDNLIGQLSDGAVSMPALGFAMGDVVLGELINEMPAATRDRLETVITGTEPDRHLRRDREGRTPRRCARADSRTARSRLSRRLPAHGRQRSRKQFQTAEERRRANALFSTATNGRR